MTDLLPISQLADQIDADSWTPVNLNTLPDKPPIRPDLAQTGLVYPGKRHVFSGPPESAKTLAAYTILIQTARTNQTGILIDFEMGPYDARQRLHELGATIDELDRILYLEPDQPATDQRIQTLIEHEPALVVVDAAAGAYQLEGLDDNKRGDVEKISRLYVTAFWRHGIATILIDHVVKNSDDRGRFVIGSERKLGGADVHLGFDTITPVSRGTSGRYKITTHKDRGGYLKRGHLADLTLESDPSSHQIAWTFTEAAASDTAYFRPTHLMEKVSRHLEQQTEPQTRNQIFDALGGNKANLIKAINALTIERFLTEEAGPNRAQLVRSSRDYRENNTDCNPQSIKQIRTLFGSTEPPETTCPTRQQNDPQTDEWYHDTPKPPNPTNHAKNQATTPGGSGWFPGGSETTPSEEASGSAEGLSPRRGETAGTKRALGEPPDPQPHLGWIDDNGSLTDTDLEWLDHIAPDPPADTDIDWTHP